MKILITSVFAALVVPAGADILTLKDGTKLDATILSKTLEEYELEVNVTKTIKERRTIKRLEVESVETTIQADVIFEEKIAGLSPVPPFLELKDYDARIKVIEDFLEEYRISSAGTKANAMLKGLKEEREQIAKGSLRIAAGDSGIVSAEELEKDEIGISSKAAEAEFRALVGKRSYLAALRKYSDLENNYFASKAQREALPLMKKLTNTYADLLWKQTESLNESADRRQAALDRLSPADQKRAEEIDEKRRASFEQIWAKEEKEGQTWFSVDTKNTESMAEAIDALEDELKRLDQVSDELKELQETDELYRQGWIAAGDKKKEELEEILDGLEQAGLSEDHLNKLIDRFDPTINNPPAEEAEESEEGEEAEADQSEEASEEDNTEEAAAEDEQ